VKANRRASAHAPDRRLKDTELRIPRRFVAMRDLTIGPGGAVDDAKRQLADVFAGERELGRQIEKEEGVERAAAQTTSRVSARHMRDLPRRDAQKAEGQTR
jgi:hypothetical protein